MQDIRVTMHTRDSVLRAFFFMTSCVFGSMIGIK
jgi:hypothetical protein